MSHLKTAPVDMFTTLRPKLLIGQLLQDIKSVQASISRFGLLSPIIVTRSEGRLVVVDGRKRLAAIRRLEFVGRLPRSLVNIPYVEVQDLGHAEADAPGLMSNRDLYTTVIGMFREDQNVARIANDLYLCRNMVKDILTLARLSARLRKAFFDRNIDFGQAKAYAALPDQRVQERSFMALGPFADAQSILKYAAKAEPAISAPLRIAA